MIHQYRLDGHNIVLDTCSGSVHVVDDVAYDVISMFENSGKDEIVSTVSARYPGRPEATPEEVAACPTSYTGIFLKPFLEKK